MSDKSTKIHKVKSDVGSLELTEEYIRQRAYHRFEQRGQQHGHDLEDWVEAEAEIFGRKAGRTSSEGGASRGVAA